MVEVFILLWSAIIGLFRSRVRLECPPTRRLEAWRRISRDLDPGKLKALTTHVKVEDVPRVAREIVEGRIRGRVVVDL
jgi:NADPH:quinone reductase-like Zn-dependent oxidoreductase